MMPCETAALTYDVFDLERITDATGTLYVGELAQRSGVPFRRIYFLTGVPRGTVRGGHAHRQQAEYLICAQGSVEVRIESRGAQSSVLLDRPERVLHLPAGYWRDLVDFSSDALIAVLATDSFDESDYVRDRAAFRRWERAMESESRWHAGTRGTTGP